MKNFDQFFDTPAKRYPTISRNDVLERLSQRIDATREDKKSRSVLLYGTGGIGKTSFLRNEVPKNFVKDTIYLGPFDIDDAEYWLLSNLERTIAQVLDPEARFFKPYFDYQSTMPGKELIAPVTSKVGPEVLVAYSRQGVQLFRKCYSKCVEEQKITPVLALDTLESIRGRDFESRLIRWLRGLRSTVIILASRPVYPEGGRDTLAEKLSEGMEEGRCEVHELLRFSPEQSRAYLLESEVGQELEEDQLQAIVDMAEGYPLRLAMTVEHLQSEGEPPELKRWIEPGTDKNVLIDEFQDTLMARYKQPGDFWLEAVLRLGVVRRRVSFAVWKQLMRVKMNQNPLVSDGLLSASEEEDNVLLDGITSWAQAWDRLKALPWVRTRANDAYVTLHDAFAESLAQRLVGTRDVFKNSRRVLWQAAAGIYQTLVKQNEPALNAAREALETKLRELDGNHTESSDAVAQAIEYSVQATEHFLLEATAFHYRLLSDRESAVDEFAEMFSDSSNVPSQLIELKYLEIQHFLPDRATDDPAPSGTTYDPLNDILRPEIEDFRAWYRSHPDIRYKVERGVADYSFKRGRPQEALPWLNGLLKLEGLSPKDIYNLLILRGDVHLQISGASDFAYEDYQAALRLTEDSQSPPEVQKKQNHALRHLGSYYRHVGEGDRSAEHYRKALQKTPYGEEYRKEKAYIQYYYGFVLGSRGRYKDALGQIDAAYQSARRLNDNRLMALVLHVRGNVERMAGQYEKAYETLRVSEGQFTKLGSSGWVGVVRQVRAICLHDAAKAGQCLGEYASIDEMHTSAQTLVLQAIRLCRTYREASLPMALNRAGTIFKNVDANQSLEYFDEGSLVATDVFDRVFRIENAVEYVSLACELWYATGDFSYRDKIDDKAVDLEKAFQARAQNAFLDLRGRWDVVQGHCKVIEGLSNPDREEAQALLAEALKLYVDGYANIARGNPSGSAGLALEENSKGLLAQMSRLKPNVKNKWLETFDTAWRGLGDEDAEHIAPLTTFVGNIDILA